MTNEMPYAGDCALSDEIFHLYADYIFRYAGISLGISKKSLLMSRLRKRLTALNIDSFSDYFKLVKKDDNERDLMLNAIVTNTTNFFREKHHFDYLQGSVVPELLSYKRDSRQMRIWSAGCSTGEEPYSIAISICEALAGRFPGAGVSDPWRGWDIRILATDISTKALEKAIAGEYDAVESVEKIPEKLVSRYFRKDGDGYLTVKDFLKQSIRFRRLNFKDSDYPFSKCFDVIFCRNVMIYFEEKMKKHMLDRFHNYLAPGGHLFLGHSETMRVNEGFTLAGVTTYRRS